MQVPIDAGRTQLAEFESQVQSEMDRLAILVEEMAKSRDANPRIPSETSHKLSKAA